MNKDKNKLLMVDRKVLLPCKQTQIIQHKIKLVIGFSSKN